MTTKTKTTKRKVGRPTLASMGLPPRERRNFNMQRTPQFDSDLMFVRQVMAIRKNVKVGDISRTEAVNAAMEVYAQLLAKAGSMVYDGATPQCPRCNGLGYLYITKGDDDTPCPECATQSDTSVSF